MGKSSPTCGDLTCRVSDVCPIDIPADVTIEVAGQDVAVKGPKGELSLTVARPIEVKIEEGQVLVTRPDDERASRSLHGLTRTLINNNIIGVTQGYTKGLEVVGTGYRVAQKGDVRRVRARLLAPRSRQAARRHHASRSRATTSSP